MDNLDYYTVMESRINYYQHKYDPQNKLRKAANRIVIVKPPDPPIVIKSPKRKKLLERLDPVIGLFL